MERKLRRLEDTMIVCGYGVFIFGVWNFVKVLMYIIFDEEGMRHIFEMMDFDYEFRYYAYVVMIFICCIDLWIRYYVKKSAWKDAIRERRKLPVYIILAAAIAAVSIFSLQQYLFTDSFRFAIADSIASVLIEATSLIITLQLVIAAVWSRILRKKLS